MVLTKPKPLLKPDYRVYNPKTKKYQIPKCYGINQEAEMILNGLTADEWEDRHMEILRYKWAKQRISQDKTNAKAKYKREALLFLHILL
jgi:hypothetical protein